MNHSDQPPDLLDSFPPTILIAEGPDASLTRTPGLQYVAARTKLLLASGFYVAAFLWAYAAIISPNFAYDGLTCNWPDTPAMACVVIMSLIPCLFLPYALSRPSALILWWLYLAVYIPSLLVPVLTLSMSFEYFLTLQLCLLLCMALLSWAGSTRRLEVGQVVLNPKLYWPSFWLVWGTCLSYIVVSGGVNALIANFASLFNGASEYSIRNDFSKLLAVSGPLLAYVCGELGHALDPFLVAYGLLYRRRWCLFAGIFGQIVLFGFTGLKVILVSSLFLALVAVLAGSYRKTFGLALPFALTVILLLCTGADLVTHNLYLSSVFTRRNLVVPGLMTGFYFEHYSHTGPVGIGFHFTHDPNVLTPPNEIGLVYFRDVDTNANANLWAEGFAELGLPGMVAFTLFTAFLIWLYDSLAAKRNLVMATLLVAMPAITVANTSPTTVLVSWGGGVAALLLYLAPLPESAAEIIV